MNLHVVRRTLGRMVVAAMVRKGEEWFGFALLLVLVVAVRVFVGRNVRSKNKEDRKQGARTKEAQQGREEREIVYDRVTSRHPAVGIGDQSNERSFECMGSPSMPIQPHSRTSDNIPAHRQ